MNAQRLLSAAESGDEREVEALLDAGADPDAATPGGETALMRAASRGHAGVVRSLVVCGADANLSRGDGWTALMLASFFGHAEAVRALVAAGADIGASDRKGSNALSWAASRGHVEIAKFLKDAAPEQRRQPARDSRDEPAARAPQRPAPVERVVAQERAAARPHVAAQERDAATRPARRPAALAAAARAEESPAARAGETFAAKHAVNAEAVEEVFSATRVSAAAPPQEAEGARAHAGGEVSRRVDVEATRLVESVAAGRREEGIIAEAPKGAPRARTLRPLAYAVPVLLAVAAGAALAYRYASSPPRDARPAPQAEQTGAANAPPQGATAVEPLSAATPSEPSAPAIAPGVVAPTPFAPLAEAGEVFTPPAEPVRNARERTGVYQPRDAGGLSPGSEPAVVDLSSGEVTSEPRREAVGAGRQQARPERQEPPASTGYVERREVLAPQSAPPRQTTQPAPAPKKAKEIPWP